jgi:hypothetical protein
MADAPLPPLATPHQTADDIIADCDGDPRAAVIELLAIIRSPRKPNAARGRVARICAAKADRVWIVALSIWSLGYGQDHHFNCCQTSDRR